MVLYLFPSKKENKQWFVIQSYNQYYSMLLKPSLSLSALLWSRCTEQANLCSLNGESSWAFPYGFHILFLFSPVSAAEQRTKLCSSVLLLAISGYTLKNWELREAQTHSLLDPAGAVVLTVSTFQFVMNSSNLMMW